MYLEFQQMILKYSNVGEQHRYNYYNCHICMNWLFQSLCRLTEMNMLTTEEVQQNFNFQRAVSVTELNT